MRRHTIVPSVLIVTLFLAAVAISAARKTGDSELVQALGGAERFLTHVATDKPIYRAGESVFVRAVVLRADNHEPLDKLTAGFPVQVEIRDPKGSVVVRSWSQMADSTAGFQWVVPEGQAGGEYTVTVSHPQTGLAPGVRKFDVRAYRAPRLKSQIEFVRKGYGPGDQVTALLSVERAEGGFPAGAKVTAVARVDDAEAWRGQAAVDALGKCQVQFPLPAKIERGDGTLAMVIEDGGVVETASKTIPILVKTVDVSLYPEGGDLVNGLMTRVYVQALTPAKKPADIRGVVVDSKGNQVAQFATEHEGRGRFTITPSADETYTLRVTEPAGVARTFPLPAVARTGVVLGAGRDVFEAGRPIELSVCTTGDIPVRLTLNKRERLISEVEFEAMPAGNVGSVSFNPTRDVDGVLTAMVWSADGKPLAERLVFRKPADAVKVEVTADQSSYVPGGPVVLTIRTTRASGEPVSAVVGLAVTDDSVLEMIEKREQAPRLPVMVLLEGEVRDLADAHVYLDEANKDAPRAVDLLLGTQGWRRFALVDLKKFLAANGDDAWRVLAMRTVPVEKLAQWAESWRKGSRSSAANGRDDLAVLDEIPMPGGAPMPDREEGKLPQFGIQGKGDNKPKPGRPVDAAAAANGPVKLGELAKDLRAGEDLDRKARFSLKAADAEFDEIRGRRLQQVVYVREYAHQVRPNRQPGDRVDFAETLYWHAGLRTDAKTGLATVRFDLSDSVTAFRVAADAFTDSGALGAGTATIESVEPFYAEPKLPLEVTMGDVIRLPVSLVNGTGERADCSLQIGGPEGIVVRDGNGRKVALTPRQRERLIVELSVGKLTGAQSITIDASAGRFSDRVTRTLQVAPMGYPMEMAWGGMLSPGETFTCTIDVPKDVVPQSARSTLRGYPSPLANLTEALKRLMQEPYGCFEQTSSTTYPLVMAQQYFKSHTGVDPAVVSRSDELLGKGYQRLVSFECKSRGYEWFGADPGHETLTAFGLMEFVDMSAVRAVDPEMIERTRGWLLATRDGKGSFTRARRALHTWIVDRDCSNGYILWSALESGIRQDQLAGEISFFLDSAAASDNSYVIALGANVAAMTGNNDAARPLMRKLADRQKPDGMVDGGTATIVGSQGQALQIETTALAALAWMRDKSFAANVEPAMNWLAESCKAGRYGSTQSTVLALRAIVTYDRTRSSVKAPGKLAVVVDGHAMGGAVEFGPDSGSAIELSDIAEMLSPGRHVVEIKMTGGSPMPVSVAVNLTRQVPDSSDKCQVAVSARLTSDRVAEGEVTEARVSVSNRAEDEVIPMPVAIIGIPGGLEVRHDQLKELVKAGRIAAYEVRGREVILYWRELQAGQKIDLPISLVAAVPGTYTAPPSRAYLYYADEWKSWIAPLKVDITPRPAD